MVNGEKYGYLQLSYLETDPLMTQHTELIKTGPGLLNFTAGKIGRLIERAAVKHTLSEREEKLSIAFELANFGMGLIYPDYKFIKVNKFLCNMLGYSEEEFFKTNCL